LACPVYTHACKYIYIDEHRKSMLVSAVDIGIHRIIGASKWPLSTVTSCKSLLQQTM